MRVEEGFQQTVYPDEHPYLDDPVLPGLLKRLLPNDVHNSVESDLERIGKILVEDIRPLAALVKEPKLTQYNEHGRRIDRLDISEGWRRMEEHAIREGYVAIGHDRKVYSEYGRIYMFAKSMVGKGDTDMIMCPLSMTDGTVRVLELFGSERMKKELISRLLSREPSKAYLSGQWMTERPGGSDVSLSETTATPTDTTSTDLGPAYLLNGFKWFSSAAYGNMAVALARTGPLSAGSRALSLFLVPLRLPPHSSSALDNGVRMHRLKNKIGTTGLPTAELSLDNTRAWRIGNEGEGVKLVVPVLNITRIHSAIHSVGALARGLSIARSYATVRSVMSGTKRLSEVPMHLATLADITVLYRVLTHLTFGAVALLGKVECGTASTDEERRLRLLTPALKAYAAELVPTALEECMAALGGLGYMEETGIGRLIRDVLVERIWEGTFNILAIDLLRASRDSSVLESYLKWANNLLASASSSQRINKSLMSPLKTIHASLFLLPTLFTSPSTQRNPGALLHLFAATTAALYLLEHALWSSSVGREDKKQVDIDVESVTRWVVDWELESLAEKAKRTMNKEESKAEMDKDIVYGGSIGQGKKRLTKL